mgnify:CR=1 FL=1
MTGHSARHTPSNSAQTIAENQWIDYVEAADESNDKLVLVDTETGMSIAVDHQSWNAWVDAIEYFAAGHCERHDCYGVDPAHVESLAALIREVDGDHTMGAARLAEALMARGVTGPTRVVR